MPMQQVEGLLLNLRAQADKRDSGDHTRAGLECAALFAKQMTRSIVADLAKPSPCTDDQSVDRRAIDVFCDGLPVLLDLFTRSAGSSTDSLAHTVVLQINLSLSILRLDPVSSEKLLRAAVPTMDVQQHRNETSEQRIEIIHNPFMFIGVLVSNPTFIISKTNHDVINKAMSGCTTWPISFYTHAINTLSQTNHLQTTFQSLLIRLQDRAEATRLITTSMPDALSELLSALITTSCNAPGVSQGALLAITRILAVATHPDIIQTSSKGSYLLGVIDSYVALRPDFADALSGFYREHLESGSDVCGGRGGALRLHPSDVAMILLVAAHTHNCVASNSTACDETEMTRLRSIEQTLGYVVLSAGLDQSVRLFSDTHVAGVSAVIAQVLKLAVVSDRVVDRLLRWITDASVTPGACVNLNGSGESTNVATTSITSSNNMPNSKSVNEDDEDISMSVEPSRCGLRVYESASDVNLALASVAVSVLVDNVFTVVNTDVTCLHILSHALAVIEATHIALSLPENLNSNDTHTEQEDAAMVTGQSRTAMKGKVKPNEKEKEKDKEKGKHNNQYTRLELSESERARANDISASRSCLVLLKRLVAHSGHILVSTPVLLSRIVECVGRIVAASSCSHASGIDTAEDTMSSAGIGTQLVVTLVALAPRSAEFCQKLLTTVCNGNIALDERIACASNAADLVEGNISALILLDLVCLPCAGDSSNDALGVLVDMASLSIGLIKNDETYSKRRRRPYVEIAILFERCCVDRELACRVNEMPAFEHLSVMLQARAGMFMYEGARLNIDANGKVIKTVKYKGRLKQSIAAAAVEKKKSKRIEQNASLGATSGRALRDEQGSTTTWIALQHCFKPADELASVELIDNIALLFHCASALDAMLTAIHVAGMSDQSTQKKKRAKRKSNSKVRPAIAHIENELASPQAVTHLLRITRKSTVYGKVRMEDEDMNASKRLPLVLLEGRSHSPSQVSASDDDDDNDDNADVPVPVLVPCPADEIAAAARIGLARSLTETAVVWLMRRVSLCDNAVNAETAAAADVAPSLTHQAVNSGIKGKEKYSIANADILSSMSDEDRNTMPDGNISDSSNASSNGSSSESDSDHDFENEGNSYTHNTHNTRSRKSKKTRKQPKRKKKRQAKSKSLSSKSSWNSMSNLRVATKSSGSSSSSNSSITTRHNDNSHMNAEEKEQERSMLLQRALRMCEIRGSLDIVSTFKLSEKGIKKEVVPPSPFLLSLANARRLLAQQVSILGRRGFELGRPGASIAATSYLIKVISHHVRLAKAGDAVAGAEPSDPSDAVASCGSWTSVYGGNTVGRAVRQASHTALLSFLHILLALCKRVDDARKEDDRNVDVHVSRRRGGKKRKLGSSSRLSSPAGKTKELWLKTWTAGLPGTLNRPLHVHIFKNHSQNEHTDANTSRGFSLRCDAVDAFREELRVLIASEGAVVANRLLHLALQDIGKVDPSLAKWVRTSVEKSERNNSPQTTTAPATATPAATGVTDAQSGTMDHAGTLPTGSISVLVESQAASWMMTMSAVVLRNELDQGVPVKLCRRMTQLLVELVNFETLRSTQAVNVTNANTNTINNNDHKNSRDDVLPNMMAQLLRDHELTSALVVRHVIHIALSGSRQNAITLGTEIFDCYIRQHQLDTSDSDSDAAVEVYNDNKNNNNTGNNDTLPRHPLLLNGAPNSLPFALQEALRVIARHCASGLDMYPGVGTTFSIGRVRATPPVNADVGSNNATSATSAAAAATGNVEANLNLEERNNVNANANADPGPVPYEIFNRLAEAVLRLLHRVVLTSVKPHIRGQIRRLAMHMLRFGSRALSMLSRHLVRVHQDSDAHLLLNALKVAKYWAKRGTTSGVDDEYEEDGMNKHNDGVISGDDDMSQGKWSDRDSENDSDEEDDDNRKGNKCHSKSRSAGAVAGKAASQISYSTSRGKIDVDYSVLGSFTGKSDLMDRHDDFDFDDDYDVDENDDDDNSGRRGSTHFGREEGEEEEEDAQAGVIINGPYRSETPSPEAWIGLLATLRIAQRVEEWADEEVKAKTVMAPKMPKLRLKAQEFKLTLERGLVRAVRRMGQGDAAVCEEALRRQVGMRWYKQVLRHMDKSAVTLHDMDSKVALQLLCDCGKIRKGVALDILTTTSTASVVAGISTGDKKADGDGTGGVLLEWVFLASNRYGRDCPWINSRRMRSKNRFVDQMLDEEEGNKDNFADLEDFIVCSGDENETQPQTQGGDGGGGDREEDSQQDSCSQLRCTKTTPTISLPNERKQQPRQQALVQVVGSSGRTKVRANAPAFSIPVSTPVAVARNNKHARSQRRLSSGRKVNCAASDGDQDHESVSDSSSYVHAAAPKTNSSRKKSTKPPKQKQQKHPKRKQKKIEQQHPHLGLLLSSVQVPHKRQRQRAAKSVPKDITRNLAAVDEVDQLDSSGDDDDDSCFELSDGSRPPRVGKRHRADDSCTDNILNPDSIKLEENEIAV